MKKFISELENWFNSTESTEVIIQNYVDDFEEYSIDKAMFFYKESVVRDKLISMCISSYLKRLEGYVSAYIKEFTFIKYTNLKEFTESTSDKTIIYFLEWFKEENISNIEEFIKRAKDEEFDVKYLYKVIKYQDFLLKDSLENNNYEATLSFLVEFVYNVMTKTKELTDIVKNNKEETLCREHEETIAQHKLYNNMKHSATDSVFGFQLQYMVSSQLIFDDIEQLQSNPKSADKADFFLKNIIVGGI